MTTPTLDQLSQYVEAVGSGVAPETALTEIWPKETAYVWPNPRPTVILSQPEENGPVIGWDTCYACKRSIKTCTCVNGPTEPVYVARWRKEDEDRKASLVRQAELAARLAAGETAGEVTAPRRPDSDKAMSSKEVRTTGDPLRQTSPSGEDDMTEADRAGIRAAKERAAKDAAEKR